MATAKSTPHDEDSSTKDPQEAHYCDEIELALLSCPFQFPHELDKCDRLAPIDFAGDARRRIFTAMRATDSADLGSVEHWLRQHGKYDQTFDELMNAYNYAGGYGGFNPKWITTIKQTALRRLVWLKSQKMAQLSLRADLDTAEETRQLAKELETLAEATEADQEAESASVQTLGDLAYSYWEAVAERKKSAPTGFAELDKRIGKGLQPERLYVLIGGTGSGKTTLANQIAEHIASAGRPVFYVTSEDTPSALLAKTVARLGQVDYNAVLYGSTDKKSAIDAALEMVLGRKSVETLAYLHDTGAFSLEKMQEQARAHFEHFAAGGPGVLVIDYLQRMARMQPMQGGRAPDTRELVTLYIMRLRAVAEALGCSVLALSSQSRASYGGNGDVLASAKESGDIEYTADCILALSQDKFSDKKGGAQPAPGHAAYSLLLAKNRLGPANETIDLDWMGACQQFAGVQRSGPR